MHILIPEKTWGVCFLGGELHFAGSGPNPALEAFPPFSLSSSLCDPERSAAPERLYFMSSASCLYNLQPLGNGRQLPKKDKVHISNSTIPDLSL